MKVGLGEGGGVGARGCPFIENKKRNPNKNKHVHSENRIGTRRQTLKSEKKMYVTAMSGNGRNFSLLQ